MTTTITPEQADTLPAEAIDLDALGELAKRLRREAKAFDDGLSSDPEFDAGTARLLREAAGAIDHARRADDHYFAVDYTGCIHEAPDRETAIQWAEDFARTANGGTIGSERPEVAKTISQMIEASKARVAAMTPAEREEMYREQRESFVRSMRPCEHGVADWEDCPHCRSLARRAAVPSEQEPRHRRAEMTLDPKALEAAENAYAAATMDLPHHDCEDCGGSGVVITGRGETAGGDTCATCGGGGVVVDFPEGWNPMASAITAYLAALSPSPAVGPEAPLKDDEGHEWPARLSIRDTKLYDDLGGPGQRIYTTAGRGYKRVEYVRADLSASPSPPALDGAGRHAVLEEAAKWLEEQAEEDSEMAEALPEYSPEIPKLLLRRKWRKADAVAIRALKETR